MALGVHINLSFVLATVEDIVNGTCHWLVPLVLFPSYTLCPLCSVKAERDEILGHYLEQVSIAVA